MRARAARTLLRAVARRRTVATMATQLKFAGERGKGGEHAMPSPTRRLLDPHTHHPSPADIGANLCDPMFAGEYRGSACHSGDLNAVLDRAWTAGVQKIIITAGSVEEARAALELAKTDGEYSV